MPGKAYTVKTALIFERRICEPGATIRIDDDALASAMLKRGQIVPKQGGSPPPPPPPSGRQQQEPPKGEKPPPPEDGKPPKPA